MKNKSLYVSATTFILAVAGLAATRMRYNGVATYGCTGNAYFQTRSKACFTIGRGARTHVTQCTLAGHKLFTCIECTHQVYDLAE
jgi:hypothetical protein